MKTQTVTLDSFELHVSRVFRIKYDRLIELCGSDNVDDILEISAILRHFLLDGNRLSDDVSKMFGLQCSFPVTDSYIIEKDSVFANSFTPRNNAMTFYNRGQFLDLECIRIENDVLKVKDLINVVANCGGGVHHDGSKQQYRHLVHLVLETDNANSCLDVLKKIAIIVIEGLSELRNSIDSQFSFLEQRKRKKQPEILFSNTTTPCLYFSEVASLEAYTKIHLDRGGCFLFSFVPPKECNQGKILLEMGARSTQHKISVQFAENKTLIIRVYKNQDKYNECSLRYCTEISNFLFVNWKKIVDDNLLIECALRNTAEIRTSFEVFDCWRATEGKIIIGEDLNGRNGARFQSSGTFGLFNKYYTVDDFTKMCKIAPLCDEKECVWLKDENICQRVFITKVFNQANSC